MQSQIQRKSQNNSSQRQQLQGNSGRVGSGIIKTKIQQNLQVNFKQKAKAASDLLHCLLIDDNFDKDIPIEMMILSEEFYFLKRPAQFDLELQLGLKQAPSVYNIYEFIMTTLQVLFNENFKLKKKDNTQLIIFLVIFTLFLSQKGYCPFKVTTWRPIIFAALIIILQDSDLGRQIPEYREIVKKYQFFQEGELIFLISKLREVYRYKDFTNSLYLQGIYYKQIKKIAIRKLLIEEKKHKTSNFLNSLEGKQLEEVLERSQEIERNQSFEKIKKVSQQFQIDKLEEKIIKLKIEDDLNPLSIKEQNENFDDSGDESPLYQKNNNDLQQDIRFNNKFQMNIKDSSEDQLSPVESKDILANDFESIENLKQFLFANDKKE